jgi:hypothetical protein
VRELMKLRSITKLIVRLGSLIDAF